MRKLVLYILIIGMMGLIFFFSHQPAVESSKTSGGVIKTVIKVIEQVSNHKFSDDELETIDKYFSTPVRKLAHFSLYFILGILFYNLLRLYNFDIKKVITLSILFSMLYACSDEFHQLFITGRFCSIKDVIIDTLGASFGNIICFVVSKIRKKKHV